MKKYIRVLSLVSAVVMAAAAFGVNAMAAKNDVTEEKMMNSDTEKEMLSSVGSVSKMYVTAAALQLCEQGKLNTEEKVTAYLPEFRMEDPRYKDITVRMLMNHSSGLMGTTSADFLLIDDADIKVHDGFLKELSGQRLKADPGEYSSYCNDGFTLLELIVERVSGETFTEYIGNHISRPMNFEKTGTPWNRMRDEDQVSVYSGRKEVFPEYCMAVGSGGILSTASELCRFGTAFFRGNDVLLSDETKKMMEQTNAGDEYEDGFGLGWDSVSDPDYSKNNVTVLSKGGDILTQHAELLTAPDQKISIAVLSSGGSSSLDKLMAEALLDIALEEKGIKTEHSKSEIKELKDSVPEKYRQYEDIYISGSGVFRVSFPDMKYMQTEQLDSGRKNVQKYFYTDDDCFVSGEINSEGVIKKKKDTVILNFRKRDGKDYICSVSESGNTETGIERSSGYLLQRAGENQVSSDVMKAWEEREGKKYLFCSGKYSNVYYMENPVYRTEKITGAAGYFGYRRIVSADCAKADMQIPGSSGRDLSDVKFVTENGAEILCLADSGMRFVSEDAVPVFSPETEKAELRSGTASWYRLSGLSGTTLTFDIPEKAAVYVYDKFGNVLYSSYMKNYGNSVPMPDEGFIVFLGEDGASVGIS